MKLVMVFMLAALPLYCYAGTSGCESLDKVVADTIDPNVNISEYLESISRFTAGESTKAAMQELKECFLKQSNETLANVEVMMEAIYNSELCISVSLPSSLLSI